MLSMLGVEVSCPNFVGMSRLGEVPSLANTPHGSKHKSRARVLVRCLRIRSPFLSGQGRYLLVLQLNQAQLGIRLCNKLAQGKLAGGKAGTQLT